MDECSDEIQLDLTLSIGGTIRKKELSVSQSTCNSKPDDSNVDVKESVQIPESSRFSPVLDTKQEDLVLDPLKKREIQALRRQEAKKKREEKQKKRWLSKTMSGVRNRENVKDNNECVEEQPACKREKRKFRNENLNSVFDPMLAMQKCPYLYPYPYPQMYYAPFANGYGYGHYLMPCAPVENGRNVYRPVPCRSSGPYQVSEDGSVQHSEIGKARSNGSTRGSSSAISGYPSSSYQGSSHIGIGSLTSHSLPESQRNGSFDQTEPTQTNEEEEYSSKKAVSSNAYELHPTKHEEIIESEDKLDPCKRTLSSVDSSSYGKTEETKADIGKPPKPILPNHKTPALPKMPYVSTRSSDGKTVTGFLYKYTKEDISIVCVCHGTSFSPSEFVKHAGVEDVTQPLKHITVSPVAI